MEKGHLAAVRVLLVDPRVDPNLCQLVRVPLSGWEVCLREGTAMYVYSVAKHTEARFADSSGLPPLNETAPAAVGANPRASGTR